MTDVGVDLLIVSTGTLFQCILFLITKKVFVWSFKRCSHSTLCRFSSLSRNTFPMQDSENMKKKKPPHARTFYDPLPLPSTLSSMNDRKINR